MGGIDQASKYRYPCPLKVMKDIVQHSVKMAILNPPEQADDGAPEIASGADIRPLLHSRTP